MQRFPNLAADEKSLSLGRKLSNGASRRVRKPVKEFTVSQPIVATRLPNGNTLVTSMNENRAVEFDSAGKEVWEYRAKSRVTRVYRR